MRTLFIIAYREILEGRRNRWVLATTLLLTALAVTLTFVGGAPTGSVGASALDVVIVSLSSLSVFLIPLIALLISHDAIVGETERGSMVLLLTYPLARWQVIIGKFAGHLAILAFSTLVGFGIAAMTLAASGGGAGPASWRAFGALVGSSILLGAAFVALGYLISGAVRERGTAGGIAIGVWLLFVLIFDMALLGLLVVDQGRTVTEGLLNVLLLLNPTDVYRLLNLGGAAGAVSGMAGPAGSHSIPPAVLLAALAAWIAVPLSAAVLVFSRKEL
jgi:Cu-processing system permease protein